MLRLVPFLFGRGIKDSLQLVSISVLVFFNTIVLSSLLKRCFKMPLCVSSYILAGKFLFFFAQSDTKPPDDNLKIRSAKM